MQYQYFSYMHVTIYMILKFLLILFSVSSISVIGYFHEHHSKLITVLDQSYVKNVLSRLTANAAYDIIDDVLYYDKDLKCRGISINFPDISNVIDLGSRQTHESCRSSTYTGITKEEYANYVSHTSDQYLDSKPICAIGLYLCPNPTDREGACTWYVQNVCNCNANFYDIPIFSCKSSFEAVTFRGDYHSNILECSGAPLSNDGNSSHNRLEVITYVGRCELSIWIGLLGVLALFALCGLFYWLYRHIQSRKFMHIKHE